MSAHLPHRESNGRKSRGARPVARDRRKSSRPDARRPVGVEPLENRQLLATLTVNTLNDAIDPTGAPGTFSLREAILLIDNSGNAATALGRALSASDQAQINTSGGGFGTNDTILFDPKLGYSNNPGPSGGVIALNSALPALSKNMTIAGLGSEELDVQGDGAHTVFVVNPGVTATISGLYINHGQGSYGSFNTGGGVAVGAGATLTLNFAEVSGNTAGYGGGIENYGTLNLYDSTIDGNVATSATNGGGAIQSNNGTVTITNSTIAFNTAAGTATAGGLAIYGIGSAAKATLTNDTFADNVATGGGSASDLFSDLLTGPGSSSIGLINTILGSAGTTALAVGGGTIVSKGHNLAADANPYLTAPGDMVSTNPKLSPIIEDSGPTPTLALQAGSPALDHADPAAGLGLDQRGAVRGGYGGLNAGTKPDIGAYEASSTYLVTVSDTQGGVQRIGTAVNGTLRAASIWASLSINNNPANVATPAPNTVNFDTSSAFSSPQTITQTLGSLNLTNPNPTTPFLIVGTGQANLTVSGNHFVSVFNIIGTSPVPNAITGLTITSGSSNQGGGILNTGPLNVTNTTITGNSATTYGGGIFNESIPAQPVPSTLTLLNTTITNNLSSLGGGIANYNNAGVAGSATVNVTNSQINTNVSSADGGGIFSNDTLSVTGSTLTGDVSSFGGGIYTSVGTAILTNSTVAGTALNNGGGIFNGAGGTLNLTGVIGSGTATLYGGGIYSDVGTSLIVNGLDTIGGTARIGGGISSYGNATLSSSLITGSLGVDGGGIYNGGTMSLDTVTVSNNTGGVGGGIDNGGHLTIGSSTINSNQADLGLGGGIYNGIAGATLNLSYSTLSGNVALGGTGQAGTGGGAGGGGGAGEGGGLFNYFGTATIVNSTFSNNAALGGNGGAGATATQTTGLGGSGAGYLGGGGGTSGSPNGGPGGTLGSAGGGGFAALVSGFGNGGAGDFGGGGGGGGANTNGGTGGTGGAGGGILPTGVTFAPIVNLGGAGGNSAGKTGGGGGGGGGLGGGLLAFGGSVTITSTTIANNFASGGSAGAGGSGATGGPGVGGGVYVNTGATVGIKNTIIGGNASTTLSVDAIGTFTDNGHNLIQSTAGALGLTGPGDITGVSPKLGPLANNGGPTQTLALQSGSPAIDAGDNTGATVFDQRGPGYYRIVNGKIDIGAFEVQTVSVDNDSFTGTAQTVTATAGKSFTEQVATFTDTTNPSAPATSFTATIYWGDNTTSTGVVSSDGMGHLLVTGTHTYAGPGTATFGVVLYSQATNKPLAFVSGTATSAPAGTQSKGYVKTAPAQGNTVASPSVFDEALAQVTVAATRKK